MGVVLTIVETNTIVFRETRDFLNTNPVWRGKQFQNFLPKRTQVAVAQGDQRLILDMSDDNLKRSLAGIAQEFLEKVDADR